MDVLFSFLNPAPAAENKRFFRSSTYHNDSFWQLFGQRTEVESIPGPTVKLVILWTAFFIINIFAVGTWLYGAFSVCYSNKYISRTVSRCLIYHIP